MKTDSRIRQVKTLLNSAMVLLREIDKDLLRSELVNPRAIVTTRPRHGFYAEIARELGVSHEQVRAVAKGLRKSARVMEAIKKHGGAQ